MTLLDLIEKAKTRANITSDYALAKVMGVDRRYVSLWKKGKKHPSTDEAVKLATLAGIEEMRVIAEIEMQTAKNEQKREFWKCYLEERGIAAALCIVALGLSIVLAPTPSSAGSLQLQNYGGNEKGFLRLEDSWNIHYANIRQAEPGTVRGMVSRFTYQQL